jgi:predicted dehydrogenase/sugar phosphate isomerase/epimerase
MTKKVKVGIIGLGFMGTTHFRIYQKNEKADVIAVSDLDENKLKGDWSSVSGNIGDGDNSKLMDMSGITTYTDGIELIKDPNIDVVDICTPTFLHKKYISAALNAGKHVICEKPIARTSQEAEEIVRIAKDSDKFLMIGMCIRFWPEYQYAYKAIKSGALGNIVSATFKRVSPNISGNAWNNWFMDSTSSGGALLDLHIHDVDFVRYLLGKPKSITAFGLRGFRTDYGIDHIISRYEYVDGPLVVLEGGWAPAKGTPFEMSFQIICEKGTIRLSESGFKIIYESGKIEEPKPASADAPTGWHVELNYFLDCIQTNTFPDEYFTLDELVDSVKVVEAEEKSIELNKSVEVEYEIPKPKLSETNGFFKAINYWVLGGFGGKKTAYQAIDDAKNMGLDGIELTYGDCLKEDITKEESKKIALYALEKGIGLKTLATGYYWGCSLSSDDETERKKAIQFTRKYIEVAHWLGVKKILVVPGAVDVAWDESRPVIPYKNVWENATKSLMRLLPKATRCGVEICIENVWNKFLLSPKEMKIFLDQFNSEYIGSYFDVGNATLNGYAEHWIEILGDKIKAVHIKNFKREDSGGVLHGFGDDLAEGDVNFNNVIQALRKIGYTGPVTAEMIPFSRLPHLILPDMKLALKTSKKLREIFK